MKRNQKFLGLGLTGWIICSLLAGLYLSGCGSDQTEEYPSGIVPTEASNSGGGSGSGQPSGGSSSDESEATYWYTVIFPSIESNKSENTISSDSNDLDGDGIDDDKDNCREIPNPDQADLDGDGLGDRCDECANDALNDEDGDGVCGDKDNCPTLTNSDQKDSDLDQMGDACDPCPNDRFNDSNDNDLYCAGAGYDPNLMQGDNDNCPDVYNPEQTDNDADIWGIPCDCNDENPTVYPGAVEIPGDGIDNDCYGGDEDPQQYDYFFYPTRVDFAGQYSPSAVVVVDLNQDGQLDVVAANSTNDRVSVYLGQKKSEFSFIATYPAGEYPLDPLVADFNEDGLPDVAVANQPEGKVALLIGVGDGRLAEPVQFSAGQGANALVAADFNQDGHIDVAVANAYENTVMILLGAGDGTLAEPQPQYTIPVNDNPVALATADFDQDGWLDLAVANQYSKSLMVIRNAAMTLTIENEFPTTSMPADIVTLDANGDLWPDLASANRYGPSDPGTISVFFNDGFGTLKSAQTKQIETSVQSLIAADFNNDGNDDLAATFVGSDESYENPGRLYILLADSTGSYSAEQTVTYTTAYGPGSLVSADIDGDSDLDLVLGNFWGKSISLLMGQQGTGSFAVAPSYGTEKTETPLDLTSGDWDKDGDIDLAVVNQHNNTVQIFLRKADGNYFSPKVGGSFSSQGQYPYGITSADLDMDEIPDIAVANRGADFDEKGNVAIFHGLGNGKFEAVATYPTTRGPTRIISHDLNQDTYPDLTTVNSLTDSVTLYFGQGDGTFTIGPEFPTGTYPVALVIADFNDDTHADFAVANKLSNNFWVYLYNTTQGEYRKQGFFQAGEDPTGIVAGDFDRDGRIDLALSNEKHPEKVRLEPVITIHTGDGQGNFSFTRLYAVAPRPAALAAADFNQDEIIDLAVITQNNDSISILSGLGNGQFVPGLAYGVGAGPSSVSINDFDQDKDPDIAVVNMKSNSLTVLNNRFKKTK